VLTGRWLGRGCRGAVMGFLMVAIGTIDPLLAAEDTGATSCLRAAQDAERRADLPPGLLLAIGLVESGRRDPATARMVAWPWTINANGIGSMFESLSAALAETRAVQGRGVTSVDVGCFQINLLQHPTAFASLEDAFDPQANAAYAARFLVALHTRTGSWENAIAAYHSSTPERGGPYRDRVMAALKQAGLPLVAEAAPVETVIVWTPPPVTDRMRIWTPSVLGRAPSVISIRQSSGGSLANLPVVKTGIGINPP
jgi:hypothetical protein